MLGKKIALWSIALKKRIEGYVQMDLSKTTELMVAISQQAEKEFQEEDERNILVRRREAARRGRER